ncbi:MAG: lamin tail domain-containing protein [Planctomycetota bacterium]
MMVCTAPKSALGAVVINEVLGSTTGADTEFIELYNSGPGAVDISGWVISEIESGTNGNGTVDDSWTINANTNLLAGGYYLIGNPEFEAMFGITPDQSEALSIENSTYTLALADAGATVQYTAFVTDGSGSVPAGFTPDISVGPDGTFLPAGFFLSGDAGTTAGLLEFAPQPAASATPGAANPTAVPEPTSVALLGLLGAGAIVGRNRRRRKAA